MFLRKRVRSLLRTTFSAPTSTEQDEENEELYTLRKPSEGGLEIPQYLDGTVIYERILNGKNARKKAETPEVYSGKTGLDLPVISLSRIGSEIRACYTGPDGGLTKVQQMRQQPIVRMANLDDELSLSMEEEDMNLNENENEDFGSDSAAFIDSTPSTFTKEKSSKLNGDTNVLRKIGSLEALGFCPSDLLPGTSTNSFNWCSWDEERAYGLSTSLYEKHPVTGVHAGTPIADVFGIIARQHGCIMALADGVNWGEASRLAARCAIRGSLDYLNTALEQKNFENTTEIFHSLLCAFHAGHALILQEGGALTTLCVALIAPVKHSESNVLCVCNVGDSLCFVYNSTYGVREVTLASHDISQMRDMRDAGGALGPVDGRNPQLHNLTCSMTFVEPDDLVFITSDGVSDNFDPVVGKFCVIKKSLNEKENFISLSNGKLSEEKQLEQMPKNISSFHKTKSVPNANDIGKLTLLSPRPNGLNGTTPRRCNATIPCVSAQERHELMLLRMNDVIANGINESDIQNLSIENRNSTIAINKPITAAQLCKNLVQFAYHLSNAKRRILEDPELYRTRTHSRTEERLRRKMVRQMIAELPGKLDHASVVAYKVGRWFGPISSLDPKEIINTDERDVINMLNVDNATIDCRLTSDKIVGENLNSVQNLTGKYVANTYNLENKKINDDNCFNKNSKEDNCVSINYRLDLKRGCQKADATKILKYADVHGTQRRLLNLDIIPAELQNLHDDNVSFSPTHITRRSPYEELPNLFENTISTGMAPSSARPSIIDQNGTTSSSSIKQHPKRHARGSLARHTLGVDVTWFKKLLYKTPNSPTVNEIFPNGSKNNEDISKQLDSNPIHVSGLNITTVEVIENTTTSTNLQNNNNFSLRKLRHLVGQNRNGSPIVYDNEEDTKCVNNTTNLPSLTQLSTQV